MGSWRPNRSGDSFSTFKAKEWNDVRETVYSLRGRQSAQIAASVAKTTDEVLVYNDTQSPDQQPFPIGSIVQITGLVIEPTASGGEFFQRLVFTAIPPGYDDTADNLGYAITLEPIESGDGGRVTLEGMARCRVRVDTDPFNAANIDVDYTGSGVDTMELVSTEGGEYDLLWIADSEDSTSPGWRWAVVNLNKAPSGDVWLPVRVLRGNELATINSTTYHGIAAANPGTTTTVQPSAGTCNASTGANTVSPGTSALEDGLGYGTLYDPDVGFERIVLKSAGVIGVAVKGTYSSTGGKLDYDDVEGEIVWLRRVDAVTITGPSADFTAYNFSIG